MRSNTRQFKIKLWPVLTGPIVVFAYEKNVLKNIIKTAAGYGSAHSRDGPTIFHMRDGPPNVTGLPGGTGLPRFMSESGPPKTTGPPMEWLVRKKSLKKPENNMKRSLENKRKNLNIKNLNEIYKEENIMKTSKRNKLLGLALTGSFSLFNASNALAAAGDTISNTATLDYDVGGATQVLIESGSGAGNSTPGAGNGTATDFLEDRIINFTVAREGATVQVAPNSTQQAIPYLVENTGNGAHGFLLTGVHNTGLLDPFGSGNNDIFDPTTIEAWVDVDDDGIFNPVNDNVAYIASMAPGAANNVRVFVVSDIPLNSRVPNPLANGDVAVMSLVAQAAVGGGTGIAADAIVADDNGNTSPGGTFTNGGAVVAAGAPSISADNPATMETVFNDTATTDGVTGATIDATGANDIDQNAQQSAYSSYTVQSAALTVSKASSTLYDPINLETLPKSIPGATVRYTITIDNAAGAAAATLTTVTDVLTLTLMDGQLSNGGAGNAIFPGSVGNNVRIVDGTGAETFCLADNADANADGCTYNGALGDTVTVDLGTAAGTAILNATESLTVEFNVIVQ